MEFPKRKRLRYYGYDYSSCGAYFITICTYNRRVLFGDVGADSISARMLADIFSKTIQQYPHIECPKYIIMPNHFHAIIVIRQDDIPLQADIESTQADIESTRADMESTRADMESVRADTESTRLDMESTRSDTESTRADIESTRADMESAPTGSITLSQIVQSFKRHSTIEYIKLVKNNMLPPFHKQIWQRSFHDHIIRNQKEYEKIWSYIDTNPQRWEQDCFYTPITLDGQCVNQEQQPL